MIKSHGIKYIGSKKTLNDHIINLICDECSDIKTVIDVFTGTTRVAQALRRQGYKVTTSDLSWASEAYAYTFVHNKSNLHLRKYITELNALQPIVGWITNNYCDVISKDGTPVMVWQEDNGMKADAIREKIDEYDLDYWEKMTLITSLIFALDAVDNTVGVQQAYLKDWCIRSYNPLKLKLPEMLWNPIIDEELPIDEHHVGNALEIDYPEADLAYLDPPYSPHQYSTYYHIWDSIVRWDKPDVALATNRRADRTSGKNELISAWNRKADALDAFGQLIDRLKTRYVLVSYSSDSIVPIEDLIALCETKGKTTVKAIDYKRNIMCRIGNQSNEDFVTENQELLILIKT